MCAAACVGLLYLVTRWLIRVEHRIRRHQPVAQAYAGAGGLQGSRSYASGRGTAQPGLHVAASSTAGSDRAAAFRSGRPRARRRGRYGPVSLGCVTAIFAVGTVGVIAAAISFHSQGSRSAFVQAHGTRSDGIVEYVDNSQTCSKNSCDYTAAIGIRLRQPVDGVESTVVHYNDFSFLTDGDAVEVLVDPDQPTYAELPGSPFISSWQWIVFAGLVIPLGALTAFEARELHRLLAHRRKHAATTPATATTGPRVI